MKRFVLILSATLSLLCVWNYAYAQSGKVNGTVTDENRIPMTGATVVVLGTQKYTITDIDGQFSIDAAQGETLRVSYLGYDDSDVTVTSSKVYDVTLTPSASTMLDETVVIGYGTSTKKEITGSVTSLKSEDFDKGAFADASALLQGKVAGLSITNPNGADPNASMEILLRGTNTLSAGQGPLVIICHIRASQKRNKCNQQHQSHI